MKRSISLFNIVLVLSLVLTGCETKPKVTPGKDLVLGGTTISMKSTFKSWRVSERTNKLGTDTSWIILRASEEIKTVKGENVWEWKKLETGGVLVSLRENVEDGGKLPSFDVTFEEATDKLTLIGYKCVGLGCGAVASAGKPLAKGGTEFELKAAGYTEMVMSVRNGVGETIYGLVVELPRGYKLVDAGGDDFVIGSEGYEKVDDKWRVCLEFKKPVEQNKSFELYLHVAKQPTTSVTLFPLGKGEGAVYTWPVISATEVAMPEPQPEETSAATPTAPEICITGSIVGDPDEIAGSLETLGQLVSGRLGCTVQFEAIPESEVVLALLESEEIDMAMLSLHNYLQVEEPLGLSPLLIPVYEVGGAYYRGAFVVNVDSGIETVDELAGTIFAYTWEGSYYGHLLPRAFLASEGYDPDDFFQETFFVGMSAADVLWAVVNGEADAGAIWADGTGDARQLIEGELPEVWEVIEIIAYTPEIPFSVIAIQPYVSDDLREQVQMALLQVSLEDEGREALHGIYGIVELAESQVDSEGRIWLDDAQVRIR